MIRSLLALLCVLFFINAKADELTQWARTIQKVTNSVVTIRVDAARSFDTAASSSTQATGFIVDAENGLILTNRHVVQSGPVIAEALFANKEEVELKPVYRDPVHDFGFFKYNPDDLKFIKPIALKLRSDKAKVGREIRVIGNDAGEQLSILAGTLARLDRDAPYYGRARYNDFNTFYYQSASGVSGGSSGSPVIDINGDVIALNAGANRSSASSFFLPLYRIVRVLKKLQQNKPVSRGTLQTTFTYKPYDVARRLGLSSDTEAELRKVNRGVGMLVVQRSLPDGPADGLLFPGDLLLKGGVSEKQLKWMRRYEELEALLDENVSNEITLLVERSGDRQVVKITPQDLHSITPDSYVTFGGAVVHNLSYQQARHLNRPISGVYVAQSGYVFSRAGVPRGAVIVSLNNELTLNIDDFKSIINTLPQDEEVVVRYITFQESKRLHVSVINMDRRWFAAKECQRNDEAGSWGCETLPDTANAKTQQATTVSFERYKDPRADRLARSIVYVQYDMPYQIDGVQETYYGGAGIVLDAREGLVLVDRNTVPVALGDARIIFAGAVDIPARVLFIHPFHNMALLKYDPDLLGDTPVEPASLRNKKLEPGDDVWLVGIRGDQRLQVEAKKIASLDALDFSIPDVPSFLEYNLEIVSLHNAPLTHGGVLTDREGNVLVHWASFSYESDDEIKQYEWGIPIEYAIELLEQWQCCKSFSIYSLEVELAALSLAQARKLGLNNEWFEILQDMSGKRQVLAVARIAGGSDAAEKLQEGDLILAVNGDVVNSFRRVEQLTQKEAVKLTVLRSDEIKKINVKTRLLTGLGTRHLLQWSGALIQNPHRALSIQRGIEQEGVYVSFIWYGSPANRYDLNAVHRIVEFDGQPVKDLRQFIEFAKANKDREYIQLKVLDLVDRESVITLKQNHQYWPSREIFWDGYEWHSRELK